MAQNTQVEKEVYVGSLVNEPDGCWSRIIGSEGRPFEHQRSSIPQMLDMHPGPCKLRIFGTLTNAPLIVKLYEQLQLRQDPNGPQVWLARDNGRTKYTPSLGGWHQLTPMDYQSYRLAWEVEKLKSAPTTEDTYSLSKVLECHPAWPAASFLEIREHTAIACLLGTLLDPRWHTDVNAPDSLQPLWRYLGLRIWQLRAALDAVQNLSPLSARQWRSWLVQDSWHDGRSLSELAVSDDVKNLPGFFVVRQSAKDDHNIRGYCRAGRLLVEFLCGAWRQALAPFGQEVFVPEYFFERAEDAVAYRQHLATLPRKFVV